MIWTWILGKKKKIWNLAFDGHTIQYIIRYEVENSLLKAVNH